jgi:hypothetical protein
MGRNAAGLSAHRGGMALLRVILGGDAMRAIEHWGWTEQAERWNGRLAMLGFVIALAMELLTGQGVLHQLSLMLPHR